MRQAKTLHHANDPTDDDVVRPELWRAPGPVALLVLLAPFFGIGLIVLACQWVEFRCCLLTIGRDRLTFRKGVFTRRTRELRLADVRSVDVRQGLLQRLVGSGTVRVSGAATRGADIAIPCVDCRAVKEAIDARRAAAAR